MPSSVSQTPTADIASASFSARPATDDRVQAQPPPPAASPAASGAPGDRTSDQLSPPSADSNSTPGSPPMYRRPSSPETMTHSRSSACPPPSGSATPVMGPLPVRVLGVVQLRPVEGGGPRRMRPEAGSRIAYSTGSPANARAVTSNPSPGAPSSTNRPFFVPTSSSVIGHLRDRGKDVDAVVRADGRVGPATLAADEDVDVAAQHRARRGSSPPGPAARVRAQHLGDGRPRQHVVVTAGRGA